MCKKFFFAKIFVLIFLLNHRVIEKFSPMHTELIKFIADWEQALSTAIPHRCKLVEFKATIEYIKLEVKVGKQTLKRI